MNPFRILALCSLSALVIACGPPGPETDTDTDTTDTEGGDTEVEADTEVEDTETEDTDVEPPAPCEAVGTAETRVVLDPSDASAFYNGGGAVRAGFPIIIEGSETTWKAETSTGGSVALQAEVTHRLVVEFDPPVQLTRTPANGVQLDVVPPSGGGKVVIQRLSPSIVSEGSLTHDDASLTLIGANAIAAGFSEDPSEAGGSATTGSTLTCVAWEIVPEASGTYSFERVNIRMVEDGNTSRAPNPFVPTILEE